MSRSIKKNPIIKDNGRSKKESKRIANHMIRRKMQDPEFIIANGSAYKKVYESWNIADYICRCTQEEWTQLYYKWSSLEWYSNVYSCPQDLVDDFLSKYPTLDDWMIQWKKEFVNK